MGGEVIIAVRPPIPPQTLSADTPLENDQHTLCQRDDSITHLIPLFWARG
jgi:hypothetical protein